MISAVLDTNTLVSGFGWRGAPARVVDAAVDGRFLVVTSPALLAEFGRVLRYLKLVAVFPDPDRWVELIKEIAVVVDPRERLDVAADDADNRVLEAVVEASADAVVTGDRELAALGEYGGVPILSASAFLRLLRASEGT